MSVWRRVNFPNLQFYRITLVVVAEIATSVSQAVLSISKHKMGISENRKGLKGLFIQTYTKYEILRKK